MSLVFAEFNREFFDYCLPTQPIFLKDLAEHSAEGAFWPDTWAIEVHETLSWAQMRGALLHEMLHLYQAVTERPLLHDKEFNSWRLRLQRATGLRI